MTRRDRELSGRQFRWLSPPREEGVLLWIALTAFVAYTVLGGFLQ
jgi:hypothetical protein